MARYNGSSSKVRLTLLIDGRRLSLSQLGSSQFVVRDLCDPQPACDAELVIEINDSAEGYRVYLPFGLAGPDQLVDYFELSTSRR